MKTFLCLFVVLGLAAAGVLCQAADLREVLRQDRRAEGIRTQGEAILARADARQNVIDDVIAGRLALPQAAAKFGDLNAKGPEQMTAVRLTYPGDSDDERLCRQVLGRVQAALEGRTEEAGTVLPRLEAELREHLARNAPGA